MSVNNQKLHKKLQSDNIWYELVYRNIYEETWVELKKENPFKDLHLNNPVSHSWKISEVIHKSLTGGLVTFIEEEDGGHLFSPFL